MYIAFDRLAGASHVSDKDRTDVVNEEQGGDSVVELSGDRHVPASGGSYDSSVQLSQLQCCSCTLDLPAS